MQYANFDIKIIHNQSTITVFAYLQILIFLCKNVKDVLFDNK